VEYTRRRRVDDDVEASDAAVFYFFYFLFSLFTKIYFRVRNFRVPNRKYIFVKNENKKYKNKKTAPASLSACPGPPSLLSEMRPTKPKQGRH